MTTKEQIMSMSYAELKRYAAEIGMSNDEFIAERDAAVDRAYVQLDGGTKQEIDNISKEAVTSIVAKRRARGNKLPAQISPETMTGVWALVGMQLAKE